MLLIVLQKYTYFNKYTMKLFFYFCCQTIILRLSIMPMDVGAEKAPFFTPYCCGTHYPQVSYCPMDFPAIIAANILWEFANVNDAGSGTTCVLNFDVCLCRFISQSQCKLSAVKLA